MNLLSKLRNFLSALFADRFPVKDESLFLAFDVETTGPSPSKNRIVQLAAVLFDASGKEIASMNHIIKPVGFVITNSKFHGITQEQAISEGEELKHVLLGFLVLVRRANYLVAHNFKFDFDFVGKELSRVGLEFDGMDIGFFNMQNYCTMKSTSHFCKLQYDDGRNAYKFPRLGELHLHLFKRGFEGAHNALNDVWACVRCFVELRNKHQFYTADWVPISSGYSNRNRKPKKSES